MTSPSLIIVWLLASLTFTAGVNAQSPAPAKNVSPDKKWEYGCPESIEYECSPELVKTDSQEVVVDLDGDLSVYGKYSKRSNLVWAPDSKRFAFSFAEAASHAYFATTAFYELHGDKWEMLQSFAKDNPISKTISKTIESALAAERTKKHLKAKKMGATDHVVKAHEWTDPDTVMVYAYEEDGEESGGTVRADFLFTLKFSGAGKLKIVKTQRLSEAESQKYQKDSQN